MSNRVSKLPTVKGRKSEKVNNTVKSSSKVTTLPAVSGAGRSLKIKNEVDVNSEQDGCEVSHQTEKKIRNEVDVNSEQDGCEVSHQTEKTLFKDMSNELIEQISALIAFTVASEVVRDQLKDPFGEELSIIETSLKFERDAKFSRENGKIILLYEMYSEEFEIKDGSISKGYIDEEYCLSDIMPDCAIHLSRLAEKKLIYEALEQGSTNVFLHATEEHIHGLEVGNTYTVFVEQNEEFLKRDQAAMALRAQSMDGAVDPNAPKPLPKDDGRVGESCSCIYGNPCTDEYGCKDWYNRYAIASKNGWKGF